MATQKETVYGFLTQLTQPLTKEQALDLFMATVPNYRKEVFKHYCKMAIEEKVWEPAAMVLNIPTVATTNKEFEEVTIDLSKIDKDKFKPLKSGTTFDMIMSKRNGFMLGTVNMITGESGAGKTTIATNLARYLKELNPDLVPGFISAEMDRNDWTEECIDNEDLCFLKTVFLIEYIDSPNYLEILERALSMYGYVVLDSFEVIIDQLREICGWTAKKAESELIKLLRKVAFEHNVCIMVIQQWTKGGTFVGSNKIKHMITSMFYVMFDDHGDRYVVAVKNRRCGHMVGKRLYFSKDKKTGKIIFDQNRFNNMMAIEKHSSDELEQLNVEGAQLDKILEQRAAKIALAIGDKVPVVNAPATEVVTQE